MRAPMVERDDRADIMTAVTSRQRDSERVPVLGAFHGEVKAYQPISVHQVSMGGMQVETAFPLHLDALYDFRLTLRDHSIVVVGRP